MADETPSLTPPERADTVLTGEPPTPAVEEPGAQAPESGGEVAPAPDADVAPAEGAPESYADFTLPEGVQLDDAALGKAAPVLKELGLNQEAAQKVVDLYAGLVGEQAAAQSEAFTQQMSEWRTATETDAQFGGDKLPESIAAAQRALEQFGTPELRELLDTHGVGNHPEVVRLLWNVGKTLREDVPGAAGGASTPPKSAVEILYPNDRRTA